MNLELTCSSKRDVSLKSGSSAADVNMSRVLSWLSLSAILGAVPSLPPDLKRTQPRPACKRAMEKGGEHYPQIVRPKTASPQN